MAFKHSISFATDLPANFDLLANFGCNQFKILPDIVSKLLRAAIWSRCAVHFESEQTPFLWTSCISFATDWTANFGCNQFRILSDIVSKPLRAASCAVQFKSQQTPFPGVAVNSESCQTSFPSLCALPAVLFNSNLSKHPFLWQVVDLDLLLSSLHRIQFGTCCFVPTSFSSQRPTNDSKIEQSNGCCFGQQQLLALLGPIPSKISFHIKKRVTRSGLISTKH